ncbi:MAG: GFA family protein [Myxococcota bacterium]|nr:GFA family protein [Myxococcota bacterium]
MSNDEKAGCGCLCGAIRFEVDPTAVVSTNHCHCSDCQKSTGSAFATVVIIPEAAFGLQSGEARSYPVMGSSGQSVTRSFCPDCGSPLWSEVEVLPGFRFVKAGAFDDASWLEPTSSYWGDSAQPWAPPAEGLPVHAHNPT